MSFRQAILKLFYPLLIRFNKIMGRRNDVLNNERSDKPKESIYNYSIELNNGGWINFADLKGKKILLVNTASDCGYTQQYEQLQELYKMQQNQLVVIGFPANDFKQQEKGSDEDIAQFCKINYGVSFPLAKKSSVINGPFQNKIFEWLSQSERNGWCNHAPVWNFSKYLVNEEGILTHYFDPALSPLSEEMMKALGKGS